MKTTLIIITNINGFPLTYCLVNFEAKKELLADRVHAFISKKSELTTDVNQKPHLYFNIPEIPGTFNSQE